MVDIKHRSFCYLLQNTYKMLSNLAHFAVPANLNENGVEH